MDDFDFICSLFIQKDFINLRLKKESSEDELKQIKKDYEKIKNEEWKVLDLLKKKYTISEINAMLKKKLENHKCYFEAVFNKNYILPDINESNIFSLSTYKNIVGKNNDVEYKKMLNVLNKVICDCTPQHLETDNECPRIKYLHIDDVKTGTKILFHRYLSDLEEQNKKKLNQKGGTSAYTFNDIGKVYDAKTAIPFNSTIETPGHMLVEGNYLPPKKFYEDLQVLQKNCKKNIDLGEYSDDVYQIIADKVNVQMLVSPNKLQNITKDTIKKLINETYLLSLYYEFYFKEYFQCYYTSGHYVPINKTLINPHKIYTGETQLSELKVFPLVNRKENHLKFKTLVSGEEIIDKIEYKNNIISLHKDVYAVYKNSKSNYTQFRDPLWCKLQKSNDVLKRSTEDIYQLFNTAWKKNKSTRQNYELVIVEYNSQKPDGGILNPNISCPIVNGKSTVQAYTNNLFGRHKIQNVTQYSLKDQYAASLASPPEISAMQYREMQTLHYMYQDFAYIYPFKQNYQIDKDIPNNMFVYRLMDTSGTGLQYNSAQNSNNIPITLPTSPKPYLQKHGPHNSNATVGIQFYTNADLSTSVRNTTIVALETEQPRYLFVIESPSHETITYYDSLDFLDTSVSGTVAGKSGDSTIDSCNIIAPIPYGDNTNRHHILDVSLLINRTYLDVINYGTGNNTAIPNKTIADKYGVYLQKYIRELIYDTFAICNVHLENIDLHTIHGAASKKIYQDAMRDGFMADAQNIADIVTFIPLANKYNGIYYRYHNTFQAESIPIEKQVKEAKYFTDEIKKKYTETINLLNQPVRSSNDNKTASENIIIYGVDYEFNEQQTIEERLHHASYTNRPIAFSPVNPEHIKIKNELFRYYPYINKKINKIEYYNQDKQDEHEKSILDKNKIEYQNINSDINTIISTPYANVPGVFNFAHFGGVKYDYSSMASNPLTTVAQGNAKLKADLLEIQKKINNDISDSGNDVFHNSFVPKLNLDYFNIIFINVTNIRYVDNTIKKFTDDTNLFNFYYYLIKNFFSNINSILNNEREYQKLLTINNVTNIYYYLKGADRSDVIIWESKQSSNTNDYNKVHATVQNGQDVKHIKSIYESSSIYKVLIKYIYFYIYDYYSKSLDAIKRLNDKSAILSYWNKDQPMITSFFIVPVQFEVLALSTSVNEVKNDIIDHILNSASNEIYPVLSDTKVETILKAYLIPQLEYEKLKNNLYQGNTYLLSENTKFMNKLTDLIEEMKTKVDGYKKFKEFITNSSINFIPSDDSYVSDSAPYGTISLGTLAYYKRTLKFMKEKMKSTNNPIIDYLQEYHKYMVDVMDEFIDFITNENVVRFYYDKFINRNGSLPNYETIKKSKICVILKDNNFKNDYVILLFRAFNFFYPILDRFYKAYSSPFTINIRINDYNTVKRTSTSVEYRNKLSRDQHENFTYMENPLAPTQKNINSNIISYHDIFEYDTNVKVFATRSYKVFPELEKYSYEVIPFHKKYQNKLSLGISGIKNNVSSLLKKVENYESYDDVLVILYNKSNHNEYHIMTQQNYNSLNIPGGANIATVEVPVHRTSGSPKHLNLIYEKFDNSNSIKGSVIDPKIVSEPTVRNYKINSLKNQLRDITNFETNIKTQNKSTLDIEVDNIFTTNDFPDNDSINMYFNTKDKILNKEGVVMTTYGYSGTGKTHTLFGDNTDKGIVTSILSELKLKNLNTNPVYFRAFELYGLGVSYNFYWEMVQNILNKTYTGGDVIPPYQIIINYKIDSSSSNTLTLDTPEKIDSLKDIYTYILDVSNLDLNTSRTYFQINNIDAITKNFNSFVSKVDDLRESGENIELFDDALHPHTVKVKRIKKTLNNPVSSRGYMIYEFQIPIGDSTKTYVPFIIIDLPGKEEIIPSYVETDHFIPNYLIPEEDKTIFRILTSDILKIPTIDPKYLPCEYLINEMDLIETLSATEIIFTEWMNEKFYNNNTSYPIYKLLCGKDGDNAISNDATNLGKEFYKIVQTRGNIYEKFLKFIHKQLLLTTFRTKKITTLPMCESLEGFDKQSDFRSYNTTSMKNLLSLLCIPLIGVLIKRNFFTFIIYVSYKIIKEYISQNLISVSSIDEEAIKDKLYTVYEGYYINENINGLLKYILKKSGKDDVDIENAIPIQKNSVNLQNFKLYTEVVMDASMYLSSNIVSSSISTVTGTIRTLISGKINIAEIDIKEFHYKKYGFSTNINLKYNVLSDPSTDTPNVILNSNNGSLKKTLEKAYVNDRVFCFDQPLIQNVLDPLIVKARNVIILYILTNNFPETKSFPQLKLLNDSIKFINLLRKID